MNPRPRHFVPFLLTAITLSCATAFAQDAAAGPAVSAGDTSIWSLFVLGGWAMWLLLLGSVVVVGLSIYNAITLRPAKFLRPDVFAELNERIEQLDFAGTREVCHQHKCPIANIVGAGLDRVMGSELDIDSVEKGMEEAATEEVIGNLVPVNYISVIAVIAPMVGLLGTVSGMIKAFGNMASAGMGRPEVLANNISEALITTAGGLVVGIPAMIVYFFFKNRYTSLVSSLNRMSGDTLERLKKAGRRFAYHVTYSGYEHPVAEIAVEEPKA